MENEYTKNLELENAALRVSMNRMEDEIARLQKELEYTALTKDDLHGMFVTDFSYEMSTNQVSFGNQKYQIAGIPEGKMTIQFQESGPALKLKTLIERGRNVRSYRI
jgi:hypothetical protein